LTSVIRKIVLIVGGEKKEKDRQRMDREGIEREDSIGCTK
jgi:hypothetical protein